MCHALLTVDHTQFLGINQTFPLFAFYFLVLFPGFCDTRVGYPIVQGRGRLSTIHGAK